MSMIVRKFIFNVNFQKDKFERVDSNKEPIIIVENDNLSTKFEFIFEDEIKNGTNILLKIKHITGSVKEYILKVQDKKAEQILTNNIAIAGKLRMSISLIGSNKEILTNAEFQNDILVEESLSGETTLKEEDISVLEELISQVNDLNKISEIIEKNTEQDIEMNNIKTVQNSESNLLSGVETVTGLTATGTWANRTWRSASGGIGTRERIDVENAPNTNFKKGWKFTTNTTTGSTDIAQDLVPVTLYEKYRLSCYAKRVSGEPVLKMQYGKSPYISKLTKVYNSEWKKYTFEFTIGEKPDGSSEGNTNIYFGISNCIGVLEICGLRLEKVDDRIQKLEDENKYLKELNSSLQETVLDTQTEVAKTVVVNDSVEGIGMINIHGGQKQEVIELPSTYQRVEYLESTGTQYINTNYFVNPKTKIECEFQFTDSTKKQQRIFGGIDSNNTRLDCYVKDSLQLGWNWTEQDNQTNLNVNTNVTIDTNKHKIIIDGLNKTVKLDNIYTSSIAGNFNKTSTTSLGIMAHITTNITGYAYLKLYSFKIYDNNALVRNFVACYRKSDNVKGLYDLVNNVFYENSGTGTFAVGGDKNNVITPNIENQSKIEYVENNVKIISSNKNMYRTPDSTNSNGVIFTKNNDDSFDIVGNATSQANAYKYIDCKDSCLKDGETYTFSCNQALPSGVTILCENFENNTWLSHVFGNNTMLKTNNTIITNQISLTGNKIRFCIRVVEGTDVKIQGLKIQIERGNKNTDIIKHQGEILIMPIQKPFLEDDKFVKINGKWKEEHHWEKYIFDGTEIFILQNGNKRVYFSQSTNSNKLKKKPIYRSNGINANEVPFCDILNGTGPSQTWTGTQGISYDSTASDENAGLDICINGLTTVAEYQQALKNHYVWYKTREVEYIDCTEEQSKILDKINTYKNTTIITTDNELAKIDLKYKVDTLKAIQDLVQATTVEESEE